ncbi:uncharacterized protein Z520_02224 [Fonsecaea multimorphosa CBS 102226]|uniref:Heterokaryon incompatibility domain-containing protein n=1 Tax=Fonsecaea multimorphosa CBS 102226 TaxID=1442371 RepID=A0A0D2HJL8_9EURO|nr:uncharacterized protein Z520_02224 [Fonsecaea multimorphosa CBS 102226]KIY02086.1 hypothetical protein Z520_02224 [Fonsecaea multimorphosa CBS 102226]
MDPKCLPAFKHSPLDLTCNSMRLLSVLPRRPGAAIRGQLSHFCIPENRTDLKYVALSYEWGRRDGPRRLIEINGRKFEIQENLFHFLESHGEAGIPNLWVDAICIDQDDVREKNHQVQLMKDIYGRSSQVIIWLGPGDRQSDDLFDYLNKLTEPSLTFLEAGFFLDADAKYAQAAFQLCQRTYWTRAWIVQEALLACSIELTCGEKRMDWTRWARYIDMKANISENAMDPSYWPHRPSALGIRYSMAFTLCQQRIARTNTIATYDLASTVLAFAESDCWDIHDKVYAFLGLASNAEEIAVDYQRPMEELFMAVLAATDARLSDDDISILRTKLGVASSFMAEAIKTQTQPPLTVYRTREKRILSKKREESKILIIEPNEIEVILNPNWMAKLTTEEFHFSIFPTRSLQYVGGKNTAHVCGCPLCKSFKTNFHQQLKELHKTGALRIYALTMQQHAKHQTHLFLSAGGQYIATGTLKIMGGPSNSFWSDMIILCDPPLRVSDNSTEVVLSLQQRLNVIEHQEMRSYPSYRSLPRLV